MPYVEKIGSIDLIKVPDTEFLVLLVLSDLDIEAHAPAIARASNGSVSVAAVYTLLSRLEKRGLVEKREEYVEIGDLTAKRVLYKICETVNLAKKGNAYEAIEVASSAGRKDYSPVQKIESCEAPAFSFSPGTSVA